MKKIFTLSAFLIPLLITLTILPSVLAVDLTVNKVSTNEVIFLDLNTPAKITLDVTNNGPSDDFLFYTFFGLGIEPSQRIHINNGETKTIDLTVMPGSNPNLGYSTFDIFIQGLDKSQTSQRVTVQIVNLESSIEVGSEDLNLEANTMSVYVYNKVDYNFDNIDANFKSSFFSFDEAFSLGPKEKKAFKVNLNKNDFNKLLAGFYTLNTKINYKNLTANLETPIKFVEKDILITTKQDKGFIINTKTITKSNEGNVIATSETTIKKSILARLFTKFTPEPNVVNRERGRVYYTWTQSISPGESQDITIRTNWLIPLIVLILIVVILVLTKKFLSQTLSIRKRISFVNAKGGEFALKVTVVLTARKYIEKVSVSERLPPLVKVYEKFMGEQPSRVDNNKKLLKWDFEKLEEGERRVITYIVYSKVGVLGRFALPSTTALYERNGKIKEASSNKAFFVAETLSKGK